MASSFSAAQPAAEIRHGYDGGAVPTFRFRNWFVFDMKEAPFHGNKQNIS